jgi:mevalonate kinase
MNNSKWYPGKLLLFGEHVLLLGSPAVSVPVPAYRACWVLGGLSEDTSLRAFADSDYVRRVAGMDIPRLEAEIRSGLYLHSGVPRGYGLGSSGVLCAALYDRFVDETAKVDAGSDLRAILGGMEGYFHGSSSGLDPLTSYLNAPLLVRGQSMEVELLRTDSWVDGPVIFLVDSGLPRQTDKMVGWFKHQLLDPEFEGALKMRYLPLHEALVDAWLCRDLPAFWEHMGRYAALQYRLLSGIIPESVSAWWLRSLDQEDYFLKVCGAGGGGYVLGFARSREVLRALPCFDTLIFPFGGGGDA